LKHVPSFIIVYLVFAFLPKSRKRLRETHETQRASELASDLEISKFFELRVELHSADAGSFVVVSRQHTGVEKTRSSDTRRLHVRFR